MGQFYFLVASLPTVAYESRDAIDPDEFLEVARRHLADSEFDVLKSASIAVAGEVVSAGSSGHRVIDDWNRYERGLRNALVRVRAAGKHVDATLHLRIDDAGDDASDAPGVADTAREANTHETPLGGENALNHARWSFLDELETGHFFDLDRLIVYYLKLQILARRRHFNRNEGEERYHTITEGIMNDYYQESSGEHSE